MRSKSVILSLAFSFLAAGPLLAAQRTTTTESFDETLDQAVWRMGTLDEIVADGGSPGAYLRNSELDSAVPTPICVGPTPSPFLGDYRAAGVISLGIDVNVFAAGIGVDPQRHLALQLDSDLGTPDDPTDDCTVYEVSSAPLPHPGSGWRPFDFAVPSDRTTLPRGWTVLGACGGLTGDAAWNAVITHVTRVSFPFSEPGILWYFQVWNAGIDSVRIEASSGT